MGADLTKDIMPNLRTGLTQLSFGKLQKFRQVMDALPPELRTRALVSAMNSAFTKGATTATQLTPNGFATWWEQLGRNKTAKAALLEYMPEGAPEYLEALATVSRGLARSAGQRLAIGRTGVGTGQQAGRMRDAGLGGHSCTSRPCARLCAVTCCPRLVRNEHTQPTPWTARPPRFGPTSN